jgi:hypothetical protein
MTYRNQGRAEIDPIFSRRCRHPLGSWRTEAFGAGKGGGHMSKRLERLTNPTEVEEAFVELFDQIDRRVSQ